MRFTKLIFPACVCVLLLFFMPVVYGQGQPNFFSYSTNNGLPNNFITCLHQDKQGFLWIGTANGLSRYDGTHFYNFRQGLLNSSKIAGDLILDIEEKDDFIWVAHRFGLTRINKYNLLCQNFQTGDSGAVYSLNRAIRDIYKDRSGTLWLGGADGLLQFDDRSNTIVRLAAFKNSKGIQDKHINKIIRETDDRLLLFMAAGWRAYDITKQKFDTALQKEIPVALLKGENIRLMSFWNTFTSDYTVAYNPSKKVVAFSQEKTAGAVDMVKNIYVDDKLTLFINIENNQAVTWQTKVPQPGFIQFNYGYSINQLPCWGTNNGILLTDEKKAYVNRYNFPGLLKKNTIISSEITGVSEYDSTSFLVSTRKGLFVLNYRTEKIMPFTRWADSLIRRSVVLPDKTIWLSTEQNIYCFEPATGKISCNINADSYVISFQHINNRLVIGTRSRGIISVNLKTRAIERFKGNDDGKQIVHDRLTSVKPKDNYGNFIVTYNETGYFSFNDFETGQHQSFAMPETASVFGERFTAQTSFSGNKKLWLGLYLGGLTVYDSLAKKWTGFSKESGLSSNTIYELLPDKKNRLWLLTAEGVDVFDIHSKTIYNTAFRLQSGTKSGGFVKQDGKLVVYDKSDILLIDAGLFTIAEEKQPVMFGEITSGTEQLDFRKKPIELTYDHNYLSIVFSLVKFEEELTTHYSYRLKHGSEWTDIGTETKLNFSNLQPGSYQLQIRATNKFGQWSHYSETLPVIIHPPFWKTVWFYLLMILAGMALLYGLYRYRIRQLNKIAYVKEKISQDLHDDIGATLSSMHIYGDLAHQVWESHPDKSKEMVGKITGQAKDLLARMGDVVWSLRSSEEEKNAFGLRLKNYSLDLLSAKNIITHFEIDEVLAGKMVNPLARKNLLLIAKEAMNNIAKYSEATAAVIKFYQSGHQVILSVTDNGKGFDPEAISQGNGLGNMQQRCRQLKGECTIETETGKGTTINCNIPIAIISYNG